MALNIAILYILVWNAVCARGNLTSESNIYAKIGILSEILFQIDLIWQRSSKNLHWHFETTIDFIPLDS